MGDSKPDWENFAKAILTEWPTGDLEGSVLFDLSLEYGMIQEVPGGYNSDHHIDAEGICPEEGDPWYEYTFRGEAGPGLYSIADMNKRIEELQARVAELEAERDVYRELAVEHTKAELDARAEAAEALLSKAVKAGMLEGAKVKPLAWEDWSARHRTNVTAMTEFGRYGVMQLHFPEMHYKIEPPHGKPSSADTLEAAKDAAQADYEARIRAALDEPDPETIARIVAQLKEDRG